MGHWGKLTYAQKNCVSAVGKLMQDSEMVHPGARIGVAVSGGSDSFALIKTLTIRKAIIPFPVELMILHVNPGFDDQSHLPLVQWAKENGLASHMELTDFGPYAHSDENTSSSPCFLCSRLRRKRLFELCRDYNLTHLAMGHNTDDLATNFFMNLFYNGRVDGMSAKESFFGGKLTLIRPALLLAKKTLDTATRQWELPTWKNNCPSNGTTGRDSAMTILDRACQGDFRMKKNVFNALRKHQLDLTLKNL